jgi:hypothetical protein
MLISSPTAEELYEGEGTVDGWRYVTRQEDRMSRWHILYDVILERTSDGTFWAFCYRMGLTENQENWYPWEDGKEVSLTRMKAVERTITEYQEVTD